MRIVSYVLMQLAPGKAKAAAEAISGIEGVKMAHAVTGPFDVIAFAEVSDLSALSDLVLSQIQKVEGVEKTQTAVVVSPDTLGSQIPKRRIYKSPPPPKGWVENVVLDIVRSEPGRGPEEQFPSGNRSRSGAGVTQQTQGVPIIETVIALLRPSV